MLHTSLHSICSTLLPNARKHGTFFGKYLHRWHPEIFIMGIFLTPGHTYAQNWVTFLERHTPSGTSFCSSILEMKLMSLGNLCGSWWSFDCQRGSLRLYSVFNHSRRSLFSTLPRTTSESVSNYFRLQREYYAGTLHLHIMEVPSKCRLFWSLKKQ